MQTSAVQNKLKLRRKLSGTCVHVFQCVYVAYKTHLAEGPDQCAALLHATEGDKHVVSVYQREKALRHHGQRAELAGRRKNKHTLNIYL